MKTNKLAGSICALLLTALGASSAVAQTSTASILFTRTMFRFDSAHGSELYRVQPSGQNVVTLAPVTYGFDIHGADWSPGGASVVYEKVQQASGDSAYNSQLYVVNRQGGSLHQVTTGDGRHSQPSWGPNGVIAFVQGGCLATVRPDGTQQHVVFCPPHESGQHGGIVLTLFHWTPSGNGVLIEAAGDEGGLEPEIWYSTVYRVNVTTGSAVKLTSQVFNNSHERYLAIAPDNQHGVYTGNPMEAVDFASNTRTTIQSQGMDPVYSPDGSKVAFRDTLTDYPHARIKIMRADGSNIHLAPTQVNPDVTITSISDWSWDGTRLLVDQVGNNQWVRMIDLRNKTARNVTNGVADKHAWFHP
ncbi:hypothetical protein LQ772_09675 [Frateuria edaphi]|uniref:hypothetical protein n=1 Tax=Frateuria edaphi TaxID=2898793 RepID=UPI001E32CCF6|nr:hypothetical protein [Frateuria edaphi]UGB44275.1 hypothetical protein LQ772_09675 [Frateuria edaphi]